MVARDDLRDSEILKMRREIDELRSMITTGSTSITRPGSRLRVATEDGILAESVGGAPAIRVTGRQSVDGQLDGGGSLLWQGLWELIGAGKMIGDVLITGILTLMSQLIVNAGGKIIIQGADGDTVLANSRMDFANGASLRTDTAGAQLVQGTAQVAVFNGIARLRTGSRTLAVTPSGISASLPTATTTTWPGRVAGDVVCTPSGDLYRIV